MVKKAKVIKTRVVKTVTKKPKARTVFVYAEDLRKGDATRVTDSYPVGNNWQQRTTEGEVLKIDKVSKRLYSRIDLVIRDTQSGEKRDHTVSNMSYMPLVGVTA